MKKIFSFLFLIFSLSFLKAQTSSSSQKNTLDLNSQAEKNGITLYWDTLSESGIMEKNGHQLSFRAGDGFVLQDYKKLAAVTSPESKDGQILVSKDFMDSALKFFSTEVSESGYKIGAILIDPGHGGKDPGAMDTHTINGKKVTIREKDINLSVGKMLYSKLKSAYPEKNIMMTRSTDKFLTLSERTDIANAVKLKDKEAILYISVHVNSSLDKKASGYEVWYLSPGYRRTVLEKTGDVDKNLFTVMNSMMEEEYTTESILIAKFIMDGMSAQIGKLSTSRGIKAEEWFVVRNSNMPAVLVELGFLTNEAEAKNLNDNSYLQKLSLGIFNGLTAFVTHFERSRGFTESN